MASKIDDKSTEYPSLVSAFLFWEKAKEEFETHTIVSKKDGCEKAFRATTEAVDTLLAHHSCFVPVGQRNAHLKRTEYLNLLMEIDSETKSINEKYSVFKDQLHGNCFYTDLPPDQFKEFFEDVLSFLKKIEDLLKKTNC